MTKNFGLIKRETVLKLSTTYATFFLTFAGFLIFINNRENPDLILSLIILFVVLIISTVVNLLISLHSVKKTENLFREKEQLFKKISNMSSQGIIITTANGIIKDLNIKAQSWFYDDKREILDKSIFRNIDCDLKPGRKLTTVFFNDMGSHFQAEMQIRAIDFQNIKHFVIYIEDQTERINKENILKKMASEDPLTGLLNRRSFLHEMNREIERSSRIGMTCTIALLDLDHFKDINDTYGHDFGDEVLKAFSSILIKNSRRLDIMCRYGGEEFVLLFPHTDLENSLHFLDRIKVEFADFHYNHNICPTFSGGAINTELKGEKINVDSLLKEVDKLLYLAKEKGRNRIETHNNRKIKLIRVS